MYGCCGLPYTVATSPVLTMPPRYMTATRSLRWRTTDRSWAMNRMPRSSSSRSDFYRLMICAWIETSSAKTGSSSMGNAGRVIPTRCRWPPENAQEGNAPTAERGLG